MRAAYEDLKYALRVLKRSPRLTLPALLILALGAGASATAFAITDHVLAPRLPYWHSSQLVVVLWTRTPASPLLTARLSSPSDFSAVSGLGSVFDRATYYAPWHAAVRGRFGAQEAEVAIVPPNFFADIGVRPALGRLPPADGHAAVPPEAVIAFSFWRTAFGGRASAIGQEITIGRKIYIVAAAMPEAMATAPQVWLPAGSARGPGASLEPSSAYVWAWLRPGFRLRGAQAALQAVSERIAANDPGLRGWRLVAIPYAEIGVGGEDRMVLFFLLGAGLVVLIACCLNIGALMLGRGLARLHETGILAALGLNPARAARQLILEGVALGAAGGALGLLGASWCLRTAHSAVVLWLPTLEGLPLTVDPKTCLFALGATVAGGAVCGIVPAAGLLRAGPSGLTGGAQPARCAPRRRRHLMRALVAAQATAAVALLAVCLLVLRSYQLVVGVDLGLKPDDVVQLEAFFPPEALAGKAAQLNATERLLEAIRSAPGVAGAAAAWLPVLDGAWIGGQAEVGAGAKARRVAQGNVQLRYVTAGYFGTLGVNPVLGRVSGPDSPGASPGVVVNQAFVRQFMLAGQPLGASVSVSAGLLGSIEGFVTSVVPDMAERSGTIPADPTVYVPLYGVPIAPRFVTFIARPQPGHSVSLRELEEVARKAEPLVPVAWTQTLQRSLADERRPFRLRSSALAALAGLVALVALGGVFSTARLHASQRSFEFAVRAAMGASPGEILWLALRRDLGPALAGIVCGTGVALVIGRLTSALVFGVSPRDPATLAVSAASFAATSSLASYLAARSLARAEPAAALKLK